MSRRRRRRPLRRRNSLLFFRSTHRRLITTIMAAPVPIRQQSVTYAPSATSDDLSDYDLLSASVLSLDSSASGHDFHSDSSSSSPAAAPQEPPPAQAARDRFATTTLAPTDVRAYVRRSLEAAGLRGHADVWDRRTVRVYVDGAFEYFNAGCVCLNSTAELVSLTDRGRDYSQARAPAPAGKALVPIRAPRRRRLRRHTRSAQRRKRRRKRRAECDRARRARAALSVGGRGAV